jgi:hypothetical protein
MAVRRWCTCWEVSDSQQSTSGCRGVPSVGELIHMGSVIRLVTRVVHNRLDSNPDLEELEYLEGLEDWERVDDPTYEAAVFTDPWDPRGSLP